MMISPPRRKNWRKASPGLAGPVIFVSNEVGCGIVPENALARAFRDAQGLLNQALAEACEAVVLVSAGIALQLKPAREPEVSLLTAIRSEAALQILASGIITT